MTEDEMVGWHHRLNGHEFEQTQGDSEGQGSLACCSPCGHKESDKIKQLKNCSDEDGEQASFLQDTEMDKMKFQHYNQTWNVNCLNEIGRSVCVCVCVCVCESQS